MSKSTLEELFIEGAWNLVETKKSGHIQCDGLSAKKLNDMLLKDESLKVTHFSDLDHGGVDVDYWLYYKLASGQFLCLGGSMYHGTNILEIVDKPSWPCSNKNN